MPASNENQQTRLPVIQADSVGTILPVSGPAVEAEGELLLVGELARATGKTVRAIHLYEDLGLLKPQNRSKGRYRQFSPDSVLRVRWISKLQSLGLSLSEIQEIAREQEDSGSAVFAAGRLRDIYRQKLDQTRRKVRELRQLEAELQASLEYLDSCDSACAPSEGTSSCTNCARHTEPSEAPELVAGVHAP